MDNLHLFRNQLATLGTVTDTTANIAVGMISVIAKALDALATQPGIDRPLFIADLRIHAGQIPQDGEHAYVATALNAIADTLAAKPPP